MNITADGFIAGPDGELDWHFPYWNLEMCEALCHLLGNADTILLGRKTYDALAGHQTMQGACLNIAREDIVLVEMMNRYRKVVVSKTLSRLPWTNSSILKGDILVETRKLKEKRGQDIIVLGSGTLVSYLIKHDLIDEYCLWIHPIAIRSGKRLPALTDFKSRLKPMSAEHFTTGVVKRCYSSR